MASLHESESGSYISFDSTEHLPWSPRQSIKSTSSSEVDPQEKDHRKVQINVNGLKRREYEGKESSDEIMKYFHHITYNMKDEMIIYPETIRYSRTDVHQRVINFIKSLRLKGSVFIYFANCLPVTVNASYFVSSDIRSYLLCDVCVFSEKYPPLILSFVRRKGPKMEGYSIELGKIMNCILRKTVRHISVASGTVEIDVKNFQTEVDKIIQDSTRFSLPQHCQNRMTCRDLIIGFFMSIAVSAEFSIMETDEGERFLTKSEFDFIVNSTDGALQTKTELDVSSDMPQLMIEMACRLSKGGKTLLEISIGDTVQEKLKNVKSLDVVVGATKKETSKRYVQVLTTATDCVYNETDADIWLFVTDALEVNASPTMSPKRPVPVNETHAFLQHKDLLEEIERVPGNGYKSEVMKWVQSVPLPASGQRLCRSASFESVKEHQKRKLNSAKTTTTSPTESTKP